MGNDEARGSSRTQIGNAASRSGRPGADRYGLFVENVTESAAACLVTMVQGNLLAVTLSHWLIASRTGLVAGTFATAALWLLGERRRWAVAALLALVTVGADVVSHPKQFGGVLTEAIVTGLAAGTLSLMVGWVWKLFRAEKAVSRARQERPH